LIQRILLAFDGSEHALRALDVTTEIASSTRAEVLVLHVREYHQGMSGMFEFIEGSERAKELADEAVQRLHSAGVTASAEVIESPGKVAEAIIERASADGADLVVTGTRGLSDLKGLLVGSVAHKVIHLAPCPVIVAR